MPAYAPSMQAAGIKWLSAFLPNKSKNIPYISGLVILNDTETGFPLSVMDCEWITAKRTAAASALSAKFLARKDSQTLGIVACGVQGKTHVEAI